MTEAHAEIVADGHGPPTRRKARRWILAVTAMALIIGAILAGRFGYRKWSARRTQDFAKQCRALQRDMDWTGLASVAQQWAQWDTTNADAVLFQAEAAQSAGDLQTAADLLGQVPARSSKHLPALIERTTLLFGPLAKPLEGVSVCEQILEIEPRAYLVHQRLIFFYALSLQREKMLRQIALAMELGCDSPDAYVYLMLADHLTFQNGFELNNRWLQSDVNQEIFLVARTVHRWKILAQSQSSTSDSQKQMALAEQLLSEYLERFPANTTVLEFFLERAIATGDVSRVEALLSRFPAADSTGDSRYWRGRGWWHAARDEVDQAVEAYRKSLRCYPFGWGTRHELADVLRRRQEFQEVAQQQALALQGKALRQKLQELPDARSASPAVLQAIYEYVKQCGDDRTTTALAKRLQQFREFVN